MKSSRKFFVALLLLPLLLGATGCELRRKMYDQAKQKPLSKSEFFHDLRGSRMPIEGTVARGELQEDDHFFRGKVNGKEADTLPFPVTKEVLERGRDRFNIHCSVCHGRTGRGDGMVVRRGFQPPTSYHTDRLRTAPIGHFFVVATEGFGAMNPYAGFVSPRDRWNIAAYIRALQLSQNARLEDVPPADREKLQ